MSNCNAEAMLTCHVCACAKFMLPLTYPGLPATKSGGSGGKEEEEVEFPRPRTDAVLSEASI